MKKAFAIKSRGLFDPASNKPFKVSQSGIELYLECPRCFFINHRLGIRRGSIIGTGTSRCRKAKNSSNEATKMKPRKMTLPRWPRLRTPRAREALRQTLFLT
jgi:hypothetical protein